MAIAMAGIPAALSLGLPAGTLLASAAGWQATFGVTAGASLALTGWLLVAVPPLPAEAAGAHVPTSTIFRTPGVRVVLAVATGYMVAHTLLYTYVGPLADAAGAGEHLTLVLLAFGLSALASTWVIGVLVDRYHRRLMVLSAVGLALAALGLRVAIDDQAALWASVVLWGLAFGGSATLLLTAAIRAAGTDGVQSLLVTAFNVSIAAGGVLGGLVLASLGIGSVPWVAAGLLAPTAATAIGARRHAFPPRSAAAVEPH